MPSAMRATFSLSFSRYLKLPPSKLNRLRSLPRQIAASISSTTGTEVEGTEKELLRDLEEQSLNVLEWPQVCDDVRALASTITVQERCRKYGIRLSDTRGECIQMLDQCEEACRMLMRESIHTDNKSCKKNEDKITMSCGKTTYPVEGLVNAVLENLKQVADAGKYLDELALGSSLNGEELWLVGETLKAVIEVQQALLQVKQEHPLLNEQIQSSHKSYEHIGVVRNEILRVVEGSGGEIKSTASPDLLFIREERQMNSQQLSQRTEEMLQSIIRRASTENEKNTIIAFRDGRICFRVVASVKANLFPNGSILLDQSATGQSHYIEPRELTELNNTEAQLRGLEEEEISKILQLLSGMLLKNKDHILFSLELMYGLDLTLAKAQYSMLTNASRPTVEPANSVIVSFFGLRHPLLPEPVPLDYKIDPNSCVAIISGPNAGGKTVALKALGLAAAMTRAGIYLPCQEGAIVSFFSPIVAVMGDDQNLAKSQSTFSSYMTKVQRALEAVRIGESESDPYLLLLDELGSGTDPAEGAALALAIIEALNGKLKDRGIQFKNGLAMITSHFDAVREAAADGSLTSCPFAAVKADHSLNWGQIGQSEALQAARRMNLPEEVILDSIERLERGPELMKDALVAIERDATRKSADLERRKAQSIELKSKLDIALADSVCAAEIVKKWGGGNGRKIVEKTLNQIKGRLKIVLDDTKDGIEIGPKERLKRAQKQQKMLKSVVKGLRIEFQEIFQPDSIGVTDASPLPETKWSPSIGDVIECSKFPGTRGIVETINGPELEVSFGSLRTIVERKEVYPTQFNNAAGVSAHGKRRSAASILQSSGISSKYEGISKETSTAPTVETTANSVIIIGMRVREAEQEVGRCVSQAKEQGWGALYIVHGRGEGILRDAIRAYLSQHSLVRRVETVIESLGAKTVAYL